MDIIELARVFLQTVWWTAKCGTHSAKSRIRKKSVQCFIAGWTERGISTIISTRGRREKCIVDAFTSFRIHRWLMLRMNLVTLEMPWILIEAICSLNLLKYTFMRDFSRPVSFAIASDKCSLVIAILYCLSLQMREMRKIRIYFYAVALAISIFPAQSSQLMEIKHFALVFFSPPSIMVVLMKYLFN